MTMAPRRTPAQSRAEESTSLTALPSFGLASEKNMSATGFRRRDDIVRRAAELFEERGYYQTSMDDIAEAVGIAKPTLYHYFTGKDAILWRIHNEFLQVLLDGQEQRRTGSVIEDPAGELRQMMHDLLGLIGARPGYARAFFELHREIPAEWYSQIDEQRARYERSLEDVVRAGVKRGQFRKVDVESTTKAVAGMCNWTYHWFKNADPAPDVDKLVDYFFSLITDGIGAR